MLVHQILKGKSTEGVVMVPPSTLISDAAKILSEKRIGTVLVSEDGRSADGILSERDIVRNLGQIGASCLESTVASFMTSKLVTCTIDSTSQELMQMMTDGRFRHVPVVEDGAVIGVVSLGDVVKAQLSELEMEKSALEGMIMGH